MLEGLMNRLNQNQQQQQLVMEESLSNLTSASPGEASNSSINPSIGEAPNFPNPYPPNLHQQNNKRKRSLPGNPDPDSEVIALSPKSLLAKNRFLCEICNKGFQRDQNLQLHRRGHNLPWKLKQRSKTEVVRKKVYICPEITCVHHDPSRALGDLTGIKKHFCRKHGERKWKCDKCSKKYAVQSDWKAHSKICGTREYKCDCGTLFSRKDSFITHRAFCDVLVEATARTTASNPALLPSPPPHYQLHHHQQMYTVDQNHQIINGHDLHSPLFSIKQEQQQLLNQSFNLIPTWLSSPPPSTMNMERIFSNPNEGFSGPHFSPSSSSHAELSATLSSTTNKDPSFQFGATPAGQRGPRADHVSEFELNLSSHEQQQQHELNDNGNMAGFFAPSSSSALFSDVMMSSLSSTFNGDGLTKDFLGLRHFSTTDIMSIAGLGSSISEQDQDLQNKSWQG